MLDYCLKNTDLVQSGQAILPGRSRYKNVFPFPNLDSPLIGYSQYTLPEFYRTDQQVSIPFPTGHYYVLRRLIVLGDVLSELT